MELTCAGRTDTGVHAWGQMVTLDVKADADLERLRSGDAAPQQPDRAWGWMPGCIVPI